MSVFQNVSGVDLELQVDGRRVAVSAGDTVEVADEFDYQLVDQSGTWKSSVKKSAAAESTPAVPDVEPVAAEGAN